MCEILCILLFLILKIYLKKFEFHNFYNDDDVDVNYANIKVSHLFFHLNIYENERYLPNTFFTVIFIRIKLCVYVLKIFT